MPDVRISSELELAEGEVIVTEGILTGTHTGTFSSPAGEVPASGNRVSLRYVSIKWVRDERIVAERLYFDQLEFLQQIGAMPAPGRPTPRP
jgi:predicted ester cyclase